MNSRRVYSTDDGDLRRSPAARDKPPAKVGPGLPNDGIVRVARDRSGRRGKIVTVVHGLAAADLTAMASDLKRLCGAGGAIKDGAIELQGDHRDKVAAHLRSHGHSVKLAGG